MVVKTVEMPREKQLENFALDIRAGLQSQPKKLSSKYFYNAKGDELFQLIMQMPEYYLTDCEYEIFSMQKQALLDLFGAETPHFNLIEFGAGDGLKTKVLLKHFVAQQSSFTYVPIDISAHVLEELKSSLKEQLPELQVSCMPFEYFEALQQLPKTPNEKKVVLFLGSNIGNFTGSLADQFLKKLASYLSPGDLVVIGMDLKKDPTIIMEAYNDKTGITKAFNLNLLERINEELGADFDIDQFIHYPTYDPLTGETKSYLVSRKDQNVHLGYLNETFHFNRWETIQTELSQKYDLAMIDNMASTAGFKVIDNFFDCKHWYVDTIWQLK